MLPGAVMGASQCCKSRTQQDAFAGVRGSQYARVTPRREGVKLILIFIPIFGLACRIKLSFGGEGGLYCPLPPPLPFPRHLSVCFRCVGASVFHCHCIFYSSALSLSGVCPGYRAHTCTRKKRRHGMVWDGKRTAKRGGRRNHALRYMCLIWRAPALRLCFPTR